MLKLLPAIIAILLGYMIATQLSDKVSMELAHTDWGNLMTYVYWLLGYFIVIGILLLFAGLCFLAAAILQRRGF